MYIYQNFLKSQLEELQYVRTEYNGENTELIAKTLAEAYTKKNDLFKALNIEYAQMYEEFKTFLIKHTYKWILVYYEKQSYEKNIYNIVAIISYTDINDLKLNEQEQQISNYDIVPQISKVRQYIRLKALKYFFDRYHPKYGEYCVTGAFAFSTKFMGARHSLRIYADSIEFIQSKGYKYGFGWTANDIAKNLYDKLHLLLREEQSLEKLYVEETKIYPYSKIKMIQVLYIGDVDQSIIKLRNILSNKQN
ncbi:unnamed protein product [Paramecium octaurelia]|uniref:Uncharacterized protein n=1 Tax=Paramecium octaurelia TaxID=43137 RepID=A0A8S1SA25_PAROT|nr:unnamed protein product [Paramecium octaurelia]